MSIDVKVKLSEWSSREKVPKYVKYKPKPEGSHLVNHKVEKDYNYYKCDYCGEEIVIKNKKDEQDGGIAALPDTLTHRGKIEIALHNRCLNPLLREFNRKENNGKIKLLSLFSGIGAFEKALRNIGQEYELVGFSEIDKYAIKSYCTIHNVSESKGLGDITKIEITKLPKDIDLITHGSPCQDFSIAGKQAGAEKGSGTRSSLMWNAVDIIKECLPKIVIWENVKNILSKKHKHNFDNYIKALEELGYNNYYQILNAKDYGIPQNRERVYTISIRKNIDNRHFEFPKKEKLHIRLKDILEKEVDEKYYLKDKGMKYVNKRLGSYTQLIKDDTEIAHCPITALGNTNWTGNMVLEDDTNKCIKVGETTPNSQAGQVYSSEGLSPTIIAGTHGYAIGNIIQVGELDIKGQDNVKRVYSKEGISPTLTNMQVGNRQPKILETPQKDSYIVDENIRIRRLTPKECWKLMGFDEQDFKKAQSIPMSDTQLYKQAGNSIVVKVLEKIFKQLLRREN